MILLEITNILIFIIIISEKDCYINLFNSPNISIK